MSPVRLLLGAALLCAATTASAQRALVDVSVHDRAERRRMEIHRHEGQSYVAGTSGKEYFIQLHNRTSSDLLAVVSVDGVNVITGETAHPSQSGYVLSAWASMDIQGWRRSLEQTAAFYFTSLADSYAARTGRVEHMGKIEVALFRRKAPVLWVRAEPTSLLRKVEGSLGTGHGRRETSHAVLVRFERASMMPAQVVTLFYDSQANLVARGVMREPLAALADRALVQRFAPDPPAVHSP